MQQPTTQRGIVPMSAIKEAHPLTVPRGLSEGEIKQNTLNTRDDLQLYYEIVGDRDRTIVLANGLGGRLYSWAPILRAFKDRYRFITWDYRGLFESGAPDEIRRLSIQDHAEDPQVSKGFDMMHPRMELISGGQREHRHDALVEGFEQQGLDPSEFDYYLDAFKYGMPPHAGWGLGAERLVMTMLGLQNIREAVLFPRDRQRLSP